MRTRRDARRQDSSGFTLIELLVAITVMVIAIVPTTSVFWSALRTSAVTAHRTDAFAIAARETEALHALPYTLVGFYGDQAVPPWNSTSTVILGACSTTCPVPFAPLILPAGTSTPVPGNTGVTYQIARYVYWADAQGVNSLAAPSTFMQAYKGDTVVVSWTDSVGSHSVEQDSIIYPGGQGPYTGPGGSLGATTTSLPVAAPGIPGLALALTQPLAPQNQQEIDLAITAPIGAPVTSYQVQWSTDPAFLAPAQSPQLPPTSTSYAVLGLAAGTTYYLRIFAGNAIGQSAYSTVVVAATASASVTTTVLPTTTLPFATTTTVTGTTTTVPTTTTTQPCNPGGFTITTATTGKTYLTNKGAMSENIVLNLTINGACTLPVTAMSVLHGTSTADPNSPYVLAGAAGGGQWSATILSSGQTTWAVGTHDITIVVNGAVTAIRNGLLICTFTPPGQRSSSSNQC